MSRVKCLSTSLLFLLLSMYSTVRAAEYTVPRAAYSLYAEDLDLDGDEDIVVGHNYNFQAEWSGISILENNGHGEFDLIDSFLFLKDFAYVYDNYNNNNHLRIMEMEVLAKLSLSILLFWTIMKNVILIKFKRGKLC